MRRYFLAIVFVTVLALLVPELSRMNWSVENPSQQVEISKINMNGISQQDTVHKDWFQFPYVRNRLHYVPFEFKLFQLLDKDRMMSEKFKIMIDAGHGGRDPGSPGASKKEEKLYTLSLANKVFELLQLEEGILPILTRIDDTFIPTDDRVAMANREQANMFISIHANSFINKNTRGTETYYYNSNSKLLATILHEHLLKSTGFLDRNVRKMDYKVVKETTMPAALLEIGYLSNPSEEIIMTSEHMQMKVATSIVNGIKQFMNSPL